MIHRFHPLEDDIIYEGILPYLDALGRPDPEWFNADYYIWDFGEHLFAYNYVAYPKCRPMWFRKYRFSDGRYNQTVYYFGNQGYAIVTLDQILSELVPEAADKVLFNLDLFRHT